LLAISQTSNYYYCVEWVPSENGPKVIKFKKINHNNIPFNTLDSIENIIKIFKPTSKDESNILTISIDINSVGLSSIFIDPDYSKADYIKWYEHNMLGDYFINSYDTYYLPFNDNQLFVFHLDKAQKNNINKSVLNSGYKLKNMTLDIFSANYFINNSTSKDSSILWKIDNNNYHWIIFNSQILNDDALLKIKVNSKTNDINLLFSIGNKDTISKIIVLLSEILFSDLTNSNLDLNCKIFIYQSKKDATLIKKIELKDISNIKIIDLKDTLFKDLNIRKNKYDLSGYCGIGNSLRGIDV